MKALILASAAYMLFISIDNIIKEKDYLSIIPALVAVTVILCLPV